MNDMEFILPYLIGFERKEGCYLFKMDFKNTWELFGNEKIQVAKKNVNDTKSFGFFIGKETDVTINDMYSIIKDNIILNKKVEDKFNLLNNYINKLKLLFEENELEDLVNLKFILETKKNNVKEVKKEKLTKTKKEKKPQVIVEDKKTETINVVVEKKILENEETNNDFIISGKDVDNYDL